jgi:hypothetical protein
MPSDGLRFFACICSRDFMNLAVGMKPTHKRAYAGGKGMSAEVTVTTAAWQSAELYAVLGSFPTQAHTAPTGHCLQCRCCLQ